LVLLNEVALNHKLQKPLAKHSLANGWLQALPKT
jgi:hypothetical protein